MKKIICSLFIILFLSCSPAIFKSKWTNEIAPETYIARFETSQGNFDVHIKREWSPKAADRFYQLIKHKHFENGIFYRVIPEFVAQFGSTNSRSNKAWNSFKVPDEKVILGNSKGTLSFARGEKETRTTDLFINLVDNSRLDTLNYNQVKGFPAFGKVIKGMQVVTEIYSGYEGKPALKLDQLYADSDSFLGEFPKLDIIQKVYIIKN